MVSFLLEDAIVQIMTLPLTLTMVSGVECQTKMRLYLVKKLDQDSPDTTSAFNRSDLHAILVHAKGQSEDQ